MQFDSTPRSDDIGGDGALRRTRPAGGGGRVVGRGRRRRRHEVLMLTTKSQILYNSLVLQALRFLKDCSWRFMLERRHILEWDPSAPLMVPSMCFSANTPWKKTHFYSVLNNAYEAALACDQLRVESCTCFSRRQVFIEASGRAGPCGRNQDFIKWLDVVTTTNFFDFHIETLRCHETEWLSQNLYPPTVWGVRYRTKNLVLCTASLATLMGVPDEWAMFSKMMKYKHEFGTWPTLPWLETEIYAWREARPFWPKPKQHFLPELQSVVIEIESILDFPTTSPLLDYVFQFIFRSVARLSNRSTSLQIVPHTESENDISSTTATESSGTSSPSVPYPWKRVEGEKRNTFEIQENTSFPILFDYIDEEDKSITLRMALVLGPNSAVSVFGEKDSYSFLEKLADDEDDDDDSDHEVSEMRTE